MKERINEDLKEQVIGVLIGLNLIMEMKSKKNQRIWDLLSDKSQKDIIKIAKAINTK